MRQAERRWAVNSPVGVQAGHDRSSGPAAASSAGTLTKGGNAAGASGAGEGGDVSSFRMLSRLPGGSSGWETASGGGEGPE